MSRMRIRELYCQFLSPPDSQIAGQYEAALRAWEQMTSDPPASQVTFDCVEAFRWRHTAEATVNGQTEDCWRFLRSILIAADRHGIVIPYLCLSI